jgi:GxxExxY protein
VRKDKVYELTEYEEWLCKEIVDCAYRVHKELGPGLLEKIYEVCFCHELAKKGIKYKRQMYLPVYYDGLFFEEGLRADVFVEDIVICEIKAVEQVNSLWPAQLRSHLKLTNNNIGFIINFNVVLIKNGIRR